MSTRMVVETHKPRCRTKLDRMMGSGHTDTCNRAAGHNGWHGGESYRWDPRWNENRNPGWTR